MWFLCVVREGGRGRARSRARAGTGSMARVDDSRMLTRMLTWRLTSRLDSRLSKQNGTIKSFGKGILGEAATKKLNEASRQKSALEIMGEHERAKQRAKAERRAAKEAKVAARLEREEFERTGGQVKLSKKERKKMEMDMED